MADQVQPVPLFTYQAFENFFNRKEYDFERIPLFTLGCICLLASKFESFSGFKWGNILDFGKLGRNISRFVGYWELVDFFKGATKATTTILPVFTKLDLTSEKGQAQAQKAAKKAVLLGCKAISNFANLIEIMVEIGGLKGPNSQMWKMVGSACGAGAFTKLLYDQLIDDQKEPTDIKEVKDVAKDTYRAQYASQSFYNTMIIASVVALKIIGFCGAFHALYGASNVVKFIADRKGELLLMPLATFTAGVLGSHFYGEQMAAFKKLNRVPRERS